MKKKSKNKFFENRAKPRATKLNPFEIHVNRKKHNVLGMKSKAERGLPGISRAKSINKRKRTLLQEYRYKDKNNVFLDSRIGERNSAMTNEDKILARFTAERMKFHSKNSLFNLGDDEELTHKGQTLSEIEKFDDPKSEDEFDEQEDGKLDSQFVEGAHFGGGIFRKVDGESKNRKDLIDQLIAESIKRKAEKQKVRQETLDLTQKLDSEWKELLPLVTASKKSKLDPEEPDKKDDKFADYDIMSRKLRFEARGRPSDRLKSEEEIAKEEKEKLEQLEKERLQRMQGDEGEKKIVHRSADDMDDGIDLQEPKLVLAYKNGYFNMVVNKSDSEDENDPDKGENEGEKDSDGEEEEEGNDSAGEEEEEGNDSGGEEEEENDPAGEEEEEEENDSDGEEELSDSEKKENKTKVNNEEDDSENSGDEEIDISEVSENEESDDNDTPGDEESDDNENPGEEESGDENEVSNNEESDDNDNLELDDSDDDLSDSKKNEESKNESQSKPLESSVSKEEEKKKPKETELSEEAKKEAEEKAKALEAARKELPYTFKIPKQYEEFKQLMNKYNCDFHGIIIERMIKCHHPSIKQEFKKDLDLLYTYLLQHLEDCATDEVSKVHCFKTLDRLSPWLYDLCQLNPDHCSAELIEVIKRKYQDFLKNPKHYPPIDTIIFFKLVSILFPTSDFRHSVVSPSFVFMEQMLFQCKIQSSTALATGLFITTLILEYCGLSKRYVPEAINFLYGVLRLAHPRNSDIPVYPPFTYNSEESFNLNTQNKNRAVECSKLTVEDLLRNDSSEEFKVNAVSLALNLLSEFCDFWNERPFAKLIFEPFIPLLDTNQFNCSLKSKVEEIVEKIMKFKNEKLKYLTLPKKRPKLIRFLEPNIEVVYSLKNFKPMTETERERAKLKSKYKREMKGALRELRRDRSFIAKLKYNEIIKSDMERKRKVREIFGAAAEQAGELNKLKRRKK